MMKKIILDCDPGHDDALAMMLAVASDEIDLLAVTTSAGNQRPEKTLHNALALLTLMGRTDIPVAGGNRKPLINPLMIADNIHGDSGLDGATIPQPAFAPQPMHAIELMAKTLRESTEKITLVVTGPMTNAALFLSVYPELKTKLERIVFMGGAMGIGNWQPSAEFNILVDPEAAKIVIDSGVPVTMVPLNVTHKAQIMSSEIDAIGSIGNPVATVFHDLLKYFAIYHTDPKWEFAGPPLHDPCTIAWLIAPEIFVSKTLAVDIELHGARTRGETVVDYYHLTPSSPNCQILLDLDREAFINLIHTSLRAFSK